MGVNGGKMEQDEDSTGTRRNTDRKDRPVMFLPGHYQTAVILSFLRSVGFLVPFYLRLDSLETALEAGIVHVGFHDLRRNLKK